MPFPLIPEILKTIFENLIDDKRTLASLARTCSSFEGPALDVLWSELDGFYPLANCLPSVVKNHEAKRMSFGVQLVKLKNTLISSDCVRLRYYASRVRHFTMEMKADRYQVFDAVYAALQVAMQGEILIPNARYLTWDSESGHMAFLPMFLAPHLSGINFKLSLQSDEQLSLVSALCKRYHLLKEVTFTFSPHASKDRQRRAVNFILNSAYTWSNLKTLSLSVTNVTHSTLFEISQLPHLNKLGITECSIDGLVNTLTPKVGFQALNYLLLDECQSVLDCAAVLNLMDNSPLHCIVVKFIEGGTSRVMKQVFLAINQHCNHDTLVELHCIGGESEGHNIATISHQDMVTYGDLKPLLAFHNIRWIDIATSFGFYFSDYDMIKSLATSWKHVRKLKLRLLPFSRTKTRSPISTGDLFHFAKLCPELQELAIPFDSTFIPEIGDNFLSKPILNTKLSVLFVGDSPIKNPDLVGAKLSAIFPSLIRLRTIEREERDALGFDESVGNRNKRLWKKAEKKMIETLISGIKDGDLLKYTIKLEPEEEKVSSVAHDDDSELYDGIDTDSDDESE
ncbi:hypothetical protein BDQ17DRAFT_1536784 [Cyathus striatus]|nr:hypothetical protein BDQ17DRAFT_1536784 [Cyathus striatus]